MISQGELVLDTAQSWQADHTASELARGVCHLLQAMNCVVLADQQHETSVGNLDYNPVVCISLCCPALLYLRVGRFNAVQFAADRAVEDRAALADRGGVEKCEVGVKD